MIEEQVSPSTSEGVLHFSTKARVLEALQPILTKAHVEPLLCYTVADWYSNKKRIIEEVSAFFDGHTVVIRSSVVGEDSLVSSQAGAFYSALNIDPSDHTLLEAAIARVIGSYPNTEGENEFFVQRFLREIKYSGVVFSCDIDTGAPYFIINYDDQSSRTDTVTSGTSNELKTLLLFRGASVSQTAFAPLIDAVKEIERLFDNNRLDIEFAIDHQGTVHILQVRPLAVAWEDVVPDEETIRQYLRKIEKKISKLTRPHPYLDGDVTYFGVMPDWNPAEIIGVKPRRLALSLYKEVITDRIWAYQRYNYGYKDVRSFPLLVSFLGIPYVDIRASFTSFVPASLSEKVANKLVNHYLQQLRDLPELHDKVEFEIVYSCYYFGISDKLKSLEAYGFNEHEIKRIEFALLALTNAIMDPVDGSCERDLQQIDILEQRYEAIIAAEISIVEKIYWLIEDCKRYGSLPFAGIARSAFVAVQFLRSFVAVGIMTEREYDQFMNSLETVSKKMTRDVSMLYSRTLSMEVFMDRYGHLRPGSYDIMSRRYDENFEAYFKPGDNPDLPTGHFAGAEKGVAFSFSEEQLAAINELLTENGVRYEAKDVIQFVKAAIEGREYSKFVFTRNLSKVLVMLEELGKKYDLTREEVSHLDIKTVLDLYATLDHRNMHDILRADIEKNKRYYSVTKGIKLPHLILEPSDVYRFHLPKGKPNFVTLQRVEADVVHEKSLTEGIEGKIVFIQSADPGYDWIFAKQPAGLVTMYGGANSHMTIRCAELGLPAVIGAGELNFKEWGKAKRLEIVCGEQRVRVVY